MEMNKVFNIYGILIKYISIFQMSRNSFVFCLSSLVATLLRSHCRRLTQNANSEIEFCFFLPPAFRWCPSPPPHSYPFNWPTATRYFRLAFAYQRRRVQFRLPSASASSSTLALALSLSVQCVDLKSCDDAAYQWQCARLISASPSTPARVRAESGQANLGHDLCRR